MLSRAVTVLSCDDQSCKATVPLLVSEFDPGMRDPLDPTAGHSGVSRTISHQVETNCWLLFLNSFFVMFVVSLHTVMTYRLCSFLVFLICKEVLGTDVSRQIFGILQPLKNPGGAVLSLTSCVTTWAWKVAKTLKLPWNYQRCANICRSFSQGNPTAHEFPCVRVPLINPPINKVRQAILKGKSTSQLIYSFSIWQFVRRHIGLEKNPGPPAIVWPKLYLDALNVWGGLLTARKVMGFYGRCLWQLVPESIGTCQWYDRDSNFQLIYQWFIIYHGDGFPVTLTVAFSAIQGGFPQKHMFWPLLLF